MHLKTSLLSRGLKLSNYEPGCRVEACHFSLKYIPPMASWHQAHSDKLFFSFILQNEIPVSLLESKSGFIIVTQRGTPENNHFHVYILGVVWGWGNLVTFFFWLETHRWWQLNGRKERLMISETMIVVQVSLDRITCNTSVPFFWVSYLIFTVQFHLLLNTWTWQCRCLLFCPLIADRRGERQLVRRDLGQAQRQRRSGILCDRQRDPHHDHRQEAARRPGPLQATPT